MKIARRNIQPKEEGFVSIFTVIFFMMLVSVITIGFLRIMTIEQRQSLDNDLTASALASAESGIEDAKRAILKYANMPNGAEKNALRSALTSNECNALLDNATANSIGINADGSITGDPDLNQYYTCLSVNLYSADYLGDSSAGVSEYVPLRTESDDQFDQIKISWHMVSNAIGTDGDGRPSNYALSTAFPKVTGDAQSWGSRGYPAYMRVQLYGYPEGSFTRDNVNDRTRAVFLVPSVVGITEGTAISTTVSDPTPHEFDNDKSAVQAIQCKDTPATVSEGEYACTATISLPDDPTLRGNNNEYYLRVTPLYGATHYKIQLIDSSKAEIVNFSEVQPIVDVTGRASDVYRRVQARVRMQSVGDLPEYAVESADDICKNMQVSDGSFYQANSCP